LEWNELVYYPCFAPGRGIAGNTFVRATTNNQWQLYYLDPNLLFSDQNPSTVTMVERKQEIKRGLLNACVDSIIRDDVTMFSGVSGFWSNLAAASPRDFRYSGGSAFIAHREGSEEAWVLISTRENDQSGVPRSRFKVRHTTDGTQWSAEQTIADDGRDDVAGILTIDSATNMFYLFYLRVDGGSTNRYDLCYRAVPSGSLNWPLTPTCPVTQILGKSLPDPEPDWSHPNGKWRFGNNLFSGAVYNGNIAVLYQDNCTGTGYNSACTLYIWRNF
jgi:hypothetical protein